MSKKSPFAISLVLFLSFCVYAEDIVGDFIELESYLHARSSARFEKTDDNIQITLPPKTHGEITEKKLFHSGNLGLKVKVEDGPEAGKEYWVYYNVEKNNSKNPQIHLFKEKPSDWTKPGEPLSPLEAKNAKALETRKPAQAIAETSQTSQKLSSLPPPASKKTEAGTELSCGTCKTNQLGKISVNKLTTFVKPAEMRQDQYDHIIKFLQKNHKHSVTNSDVITFVDLSKPYGSKRFFVCKPSTGSCTGYQTTNGKFQGWDYDGKDPDRQKHEEKDKRRYYAHEFSQEEGHTASGCYVTGGIEGGSKFPPDHVVLYGEESTNNLAPSEHHHIFVHPWSKVNEQNPLGGDIPISDGCFALDPGVYKNIKSNISEGSALCALP